MISRVFKFSGPLCVINDHFHGFLGLISYSPTTNAIMALTVAQYLVQPFFSLEDELPTTAISLLAAVFITGLTWLNCYSMKITTRLQNTFMVCKVAALILVIIIGAVGLAQGN